MSKQVAWLMGFEAATLAVMASLHLSGTLAGDSGLYAGTAEAIIMGVLVAAVAVRWRSSPEHARSAGLAALGFTIGGFILGLSITARGGTVVDIAYHSTMLPILVATFALLFRSNRLGTGGLLHEVESVR